MNRGNQNFPTPVTVGDILRKVDTGQIRLPRFQRRIAWKEGTSAGLVESILKGNPVGLFLTLEVEHSGKLPFKTREIPHAPRATRECEELLLDGQQRIMSLYRAVTNSFDKLFVVSWKQKSGQKNVDDIRVHQIRRRRDSEKLDTERPNDLPEEVGSNFFPASMLSHHQRTEERATKWIQNHTEKYGLETNQFQDIFWEIRDRFLYCQLPVIRLPRTTREDDAINIFIRMNQSVAKLSAFDIAVAQMEEKVGESLHERVASVAKKTRLLGNPGDHDARKERKIGDFVLRIFCLRQGKSATEGSFTTLDFKKINRDWSKFESALEKMKELLDQESIWDDKRLPSLVPLHVIVALLMEERPPDEEGRYLRVLRKYLWLSFLSDRYSYAANTHMRVDYDELKEVLSQASLKESDLKSKVTIFGNRVALPEIKDIMKAGWPSGADRVGKAIFALALKEGAEDIAAESSPTPDSINNYEYHHIYPKGYMEGIKSDYKKSVVNCMFLRTGTNRMVRDQAPSEYLMKRMEKAGDIPAEKRQMRLAEKLETHIIPIDKLMESEPRNESTFEKRGRNFEEFVEERARKIREKICDLLESN